MIAAMTPFLAFAYVLIGGIVLLVIVAVINDIEPKP